MVVGLGMDLVEVSRVAAAFERHGMRFLSRVYTPGELAYCLRRGAQRNESLAARYAAKEAAWKALGVPPGLRFTDMEVICSAAGRPPAVRFHRLAHDAALRLKVQSALLTLTHAGGVAAAVVVLESGPGETP
jgi:holo-[acyl-carrier protein] synthase